MKEFASKQSVHCSKIVASYSCVQSAYEKCCELAISFDIDPPIADDYSGRIEPCLNRLICEKWWKRQFTRKQNVAVETVGRDLQQVHKWKGLYCSDFSVNRHRWQKKSNQDYLDSQSMVNELEQEFTLSELSSMSVSNPRIRRVELITRCKGFETVSKEFGHEAVFLTLTTPSRFHRMTKVKNPKTGEILKVIPNKNYQGLSPRDAHDYLVNLWACTNSKLKRENIRPYGFRVAEPHHDGTPHWHFLLFVEPSQVDELISIFERWSLKDSPTEKGATKHRLKVEKIKQGINPATGNEYSATGYLIKYICKNIDGFGVKNTEPMNSGYDWKSEDPIEIAERIEAWARTYRIRQFQQIGGPSVTVYRELRRLNTQKGFLEKIREAADAGDWATFVKIMGGPNVSRDRQLLKPAYAAPETLDKTTGEVTKVLRTQYGDDAKERVIGIILSGITILSRSHFWELKDTAKARSARQKIMHGIVDLCQEIQDQNRELELPMNVELLQRAQPSAFDLFQ